jgi:hypothetical protein
LIGTNKIMAQCLQADKVQQCQMKRQWCPYQPMKTRLDKGNLVLLRCKVSLQMVVQVLLQRQIG